MQHGSRGQPAALLSAASLMDWNAGAIGCRLMTVDRSYVDGAGIEAKTFLATTSKGLRNRGIDRFLHASGAELMRLSSADGRVLRVLIEISPAATDRRFGLRLTLWAADFARQSPGTVIDHASCADR
jgi:hypothetical protein